MQERRPSGNPYLEHILGILIALLSQQHALLLLIHSVVVLALKGLCKLGCLVVPAAPSKAKSF